MSGFLFFRDNLSHSVVYVYMVVVQLQSTTKKIYVSRQKWLKKVEREMSSWKDINCWEESL